MSRRGLVRVHISTGSRPSAEANDAIVTLRVEESVSGVVLVDVDFTPAEWWRLIIGSVHTKMADLPEPDLAALIGKQMRNDTAMVPKEVYQGIPATHIPGQYSRDRIEHLDAGEQWARDLWAGIPEPKSIGTRWSNSGMTAFIRWWEDGKPCEVCGRLPGDHDYMDAREHGVE
jgi:hypothetical protein